jgi:hypothetical protein
MFRKTRNLLRRCYLFVLKSDNVRCTQRIVVKTRGENLEFNLWLRNAHLHVRSADKLLQKPLPRVTAYAFSIQLYLQ